MESNSVRNSETAGAGILSVGENTMPTFLTVILFFSQFCTTSNRNSDSAYSSA